VRSVRIAAKKEDAKEREKGEIADQLAAAKKKTHLERGREEEH